MHTIAAKAVALRIAATEPFRARQRQTIANAQALAAGLQAGGVPVLTGGTDVHLVLVDLTPSGLDGKTAETRLEEVGITVNRNAIPFDERPPMNPSGLRIGTPALTTRGLVEDDMTEIAAVIATALSGDFEAEKRALAERTRALMERYPLYPLARRVAEPPGRRGLCLAGRRFSSRSDPYGTGLTEHEIWVDMSRRRTCWCCGRSSSGCASGAIRSRSPRATTRRRRRCSSCTGSSTRRSGGTAGPRGCARRSGSAPARAAMIRFGRGRSFDLALAHGSNDLAIAARLLGVPEANMHDYEYAVTQHRIGCRLAKRVMFPDSVPAERLRRFGVGPEKLFPYPGLKEEYYLYDFEPDPEALQRLSVDTERVVVVVRPPPDVSLYHRKSNPLFPKVLPRLGQRQRVHAIVLPRTQAQRELVESLALPSLIVPPGAVEAQSLVALADLVVSAGGTMNREAAALGTPVYTTYGGRLGGVDEALIRSGRLRPLTDPRAIELRSAPRARPRRGAIPARWSRRSSVPSEPTIRRGEATLPS